MRAEEIKTQEDLKLWLEGQSQEVCVWIAFRAAARVLPIYWWHVAQHSQAEDPIIFTVLQPGRSLMAASSFASLVPESFDERLHYVFATSASVSISSSSASVAFAASAFASAALAAIDPGASARAAFNASRFEPIATFTDAHWAEHNGISGPRPLWPAEIPRKPALAWQEILRNFHQSDESTPDYHSFWIPWYQGLLDGKPAFPEPLTRAIALIDEQDWDKGELHINNVVIPRLMAEYAARAAVRGERIERAASGELTSVPVTELPEDIRARVVSRVLDALGDLNDLGAQGSQLYLIFEPTLRIIEKTVRRSGADSVRLFEALEDAETRVTRIATENGVLEDGEVSVLLTNIGRSRAELWSGDQVVRDVRAITSDTSFDDLSDDEQAALLAIEELVEVEATSALREDMAEDRATLTDQRADYLEKRRSLTRTVERSLQASWIWIQERSAKIDKLKKAAANITWVGHLIAGVIRWLSSLI